ncbi:PREDICTED: E4 SUMO-protein ligase PIAL2-like isoform X2 [Tarenaya hassleriana]|uniref:E4 SUMO-protein ligase PIAL2-like isoform X2 n=1 Tax=Tarenaya hassleriana TaxID=28532 RepID=UPI00053C62D0|nr:PREDICTED: E4 SUMO-protein ligase PIAL2-like isoform X2 [Tarenaya hassleriana]
MKAVSPADGGTRHQSTSLVISQLPAAARRLDFYVQDGRLSNLKDTVEFRDCFISLAKIIDFAIANNEVPAKARELPSLLKKVCRRRSEHRFIYAALMVMMVSVKNACQLGWFQQNDARELLALADEIHNSFCGPGGSSPNQESPGSPFSQIMERFYPFIKLGHTLLSLEVKPGCTILTNDFHISKRTPHSTQQKIRLFVARTDNIETSACIISPPEVSFLLNGKAVEKRVNIQMDSGPQIPTNVTGLLKYGTNLLQAMGNFKGHYIIVLAFMGVIPLSEAPVLKDYVQSESIESNSDADLIEGPSRISLNCPISRSRIKLPVKGLLCKHLQPVCYTDIRVDKNTVEVLKEVGYDAADLIMSTGGSWKVVMENDEKMEHVRQTIHDHEDPTSILKSGSMVLDLTGNNDDNDEIGTFGNTEVEDRKPLLSDIQGQSSNDVNIAALNEAFSGFDTSNGLSLDPSMLNLNQFSTPSNSMPQPPQTSDTAFEQEYPNLLQIPRSQDPVSVQALPVPSLQTSSVPDRPTTFCASVPTSQSSPFQASPIRPVGHNMAEASRVQISSAQDRLETTTRFSTSLIPTPQSSQAHASFVPPVRHCQGRASRLMERWRPYHRNPSQVPTMASSRDHPSIQNRRHPVRSQFPTAIRQQPPPPPSSLSQSHTVKGTTFGQQTRSVQMERQRLSQEGLTVQSVSRVSNLVDQTTANNWRPQGRMRGSLVPGSYSTALDQLIIRPTQQSQTTQPQVQTPSPSMASYNISVNIGSFLASRMHGTSIPKTQTVTDSSPPG